MFDLINAFSIPKGAIETSLLLQDLLTANEIRNLSVRLRIAKLLLNGWNHRQICQELHTSLATTTKVSLWLEQGGEGFKRVISKLPLRYKMPEKLPPGPIEYYLPQILSAVGKYVLVKRETKLLEKFKEGVENKKLLDKSLQEAFDEHYRKTKTKPKSRA